MLSHVLPQLTAKQRRLAVRTLGISAAIVAAVMTLDYILNIQILRDATGYTPASTLLIVLVIAPAATFMLLLQMEKVREAQHDLAAEHTARTAAEAVNTARSRFLANMSHELRTPLNGIIGYTELMLEGAEAEGRRQDVEDHKRVIGSAQRLLTLLNDLLDLAKIDANRLSLAHTDFHVRELIEETIEIVQPVAAANGTAIALKIDPTLGMGRADPLRLRQCLLNLLTNAAKFTQNGAIDITTRRDGEWLAIEVRDTGVGIAHERQPLLFEPFMQALSLETGQLGGAGLSLALTRQLARLMGGDVTFISAPREGSTFTLRVPLHGGVANAPKALSNAA